MTPEQQHLVQSSFSKVEPIAPLAAELFYARWHDCRGRELKAG